MTDTVNIVSDYDLSKINTFGLTANAERFCTISHIDQLKQLKSAGHFEESFPAVWGGGSNILLTKDVPGLLLRMEIPGIDVVDSDDDSITLEVGAGVLWHDFVMFCVNHNYGGVENLSLIPGFVGASPMQNIGAYGVEIKDMFEGLRAFNFKTGSIDFFDAQDCQFGYRESVFKKELKGQHAICSVIYKLKLNPQEFNISYGAIREQLEQHGVKNPDIKSVSEAVIAIRRSKLPDPAEIGNAGSFFKNPVVQTDLLKEIEKQYEQVPNYPIDENSVKLAAGWLIEKAGFKGLRRANHGVHDKQALVLVNYGGATGTEIFDLSSEILEAVQQKFGVSLEREVNVW